MAEGRRGLGRGLSALLDEAETVGASGRPVGAREIPIEFLRRNPDQPRRSFAEPELDELAQSIREKGVLQPILVRPMPGESAEYQVVAGERRWRAAQRAGLHSVPAIVRDLGDLEVLEIALIENIQRADLGPLEEARGYATMIDRFSRTQDSVAAMVSKSRSHVANTLRLLRLPPAVQEHLEAGRLTSGHARALVDHTAAETLAARIIALGLSVRQAEVLARRDAKTATPRSGRGRAADADTRALENDLSEVLGLAVAILDKGGTGELRVHYQNLEQLDDLCRRLTQSGA
jgi:ParB family chromosome partitioning protein